MRNPFRFFTEFLQQPIGIPIWVLTLMIVNVASVGFWSEPLAKLIFGIFVVSAMLMMALYSRFGFEKILGLGHIPWIPLLIYMLSQLPNANGAFRSYLIILSICIAISLVFDVIDVWKYFMRWRSI
jgi:hypothetical protein